ncbi:ATP-binding protein [Pedobacter sp. SL55]|uniref:ATP-binding protein n=1 Tax=Pedobacter sp. SL55 TaxID=2995161 RepID=UPI002D1E3A5A|nr:ATP-binding protein [Pedobacter sp. SL55]
MTVKRQNNQLYVGVKDYGIGMKPDQLNKVFEKFYRVEETSHRFQGLGIGLYISSEIISRHGGEINVRSVYGEGSEFYFTIPVEQLSSDV